MRLNNLGNALTIDEKIKYILPLKETRSIFSSELKEWKKTKNLVTENDFKEMLKRKDNELTRECNHDDTFYNQDSFLERKYCQKRFIGGI